MESIVLSLLRIGSEQIYTVYLAQSYNRQQRSHPVVHGQAFGVSNGKKTKVLCYQPSDKATFFGLAFFFFKPLFFFFFFFPRYFFLTCDCCRYTM